MPCLFLILALVFPRVILVLMWLTGYLRPAFHGFLLPLLGFIFLPLTTIVYAWELHSGMRVEGVNLLWIIIAVIFDLGGLGKGAQHQSRR